MIAMKVHVRRLCQVAQIQLSMDLLVDKASRFYGRVNTGVRAGRLLVRVMTCCRDRLHVVHGCSPRPLDQRRSSKYGGDLESRQREID